MVETWGVLGTVVIMSRVEARFCGSWRTVVVMSKRSEVGTWDGWRTVVCASDCLRTVVVALFGVVVTSWCVVVTSWYVVL